MFFEYCFFARLEGDTPGPSPSKRGMQLDERRTSFLLMHEDSQHSGMNTYLNSSQSLGGVRLSRVSDSQTSVQSNLDKWIWAVPQNPQSLIKLFAYRIRFEW